MGDSFFSWLVRVGVINTSQLSSLSIEPDEADWIARRVASEFGWLAHREICLIDKLLKDQPKITFFNAAVELRLLDIDQLTTIASHIQEQDDILCLKVIERGWMTAGQMRVLKQHYERMHASHPCEYPRAASSSQSLTPSAFETYADPQPSNSLAVS
ncbi:MAG TPA: hypothetical protein PKD54_02875 [Pirellulaceae bacterium]|nr:hypothetical protein [Pirellulaceae bacterium]